MRTHSLRRGLAATAMAALAVVGFSPTANAATEDGETYHYEITTQGTAPSDGSIGIIRATVAGDMLDVTVAADNLGVAAVEMHFHAGATCDAMGAIVVPVGAAGAGEATTEGSLRLRAMAPVSDADMENVYFNIHEAGNLGNVVACGTLAAGATASTYMGQEGQTLEVVSSTAGDTTMTEVSGSGFGVEAVEMHFHTGATCDAMGPIVLPVGGPNLATAGGTLPASTFIAAKPASGFDDPAMVYYNVHEGADLSNVVACGTLVADTTPPAAPGKVADATSIEEIVNATDYDPATDAEVLRLYQAFFNRQPDVAGAIYWIGQRDTASALKIAESFPNASAEFQNLYADAADNDEFLNRVYANILGRDADQAGFDYWLDILNGTNATGQNPNMQQGDRGAVVFYVAVNDEFINKFPYTPDAADA